MSNMNLDMLAKMKKMEAAKREKAMKSSSVTIINGSKDSGIDFDTWWMDINRRVKMKPWMKEVVKADFKGRGLTLKETMEKYDDALRLFGIKF